VSNLFDVLDPQGSEDEGQPAAQGQEPTETPAGQEPTQAGTGDQGGEAGEMISKSVFEDRIGRASRKNAKLIEQNKAMEKRIAEMEKKIQESESNSVIQSLTKTPKPNDFDEWSEDMRVAWMVDQATKQRSSSVQESPKIAALERELQQLRYEQSFGPLSEEQVDIIDEIRETTSLTNFSDIISIARGRHPDIFGSAGTGRPGQFQTGVQRGGSPAPRKEEEPVSAMIARAMKKNPKDRNLGPLMVAAQRAERNGGSLDRDYVSRLLQGAS